MAGETTTTHRTTTSYLHANPALAGAEAGRAWAQNGGADDALRTSAAQNRDWLRWLAATLAEANPLFQAAWRQAYAEERRQQG